ncbi:alpha/beta hydrolase [Burkholderiaceae bacterium UC74_6]
MPRSVLPRTCPLFPLVLLALIHSTSANAQDKSPAERPHTAAPNVTVLAQKLVMPGLGRERTLRLYLPPSYAASPGKRYPVLYMHDAQNLFDDATSFAGEWGVDETLNELARKEGLEVIVVGIDNGAEKRTSELIPFPSPAAPKPEGESYLRFVVEVVKPYIDTHYRSLPDRDHTAIMGSSLGGLISHAALLKHPQVFGRIGAFSPSYWANLRMFDEVALAPTPPGTRIYLYAGVDEGEQMVGDAVRMASYLRQGNPELSMELRVIAGAKHNEAAWRSEFPRAVRWLLASP